MSAINAKEEFINHTKGREVQCAEVMDGSGTYRPAEYIPHRLAVGYSAVQYQAFLDGLNFEYDCGYGSQNLFGIIWYTDGTWSSRGEYDGSEWWEHNQCPDIPDVLK